MGLITTMTYNLLIYHESECDMAKYFTTRLIFFHEPEVSKNTAWVKYLVISLG